MRNGKEQRAGRNHSWRPTQHLKNLTQKMGEEIWAHTFYLPLTTFTSNELGGVPLILKFLAAYDFGNKPFPTGIRVLTGHNWIFLFHFNTYLILENSHQLQRKPKNLRRVQFSHYLWPCLYLFSHTSLSMLQGPAQITQNSTWQQHAIAHAQTRGLSFPVKELGHRGVGTGRSPAYHDK